MFLSTFTSCAFLRDYKSSVHENEELKTQIDSLTTNSVKLEQKIEELEKEQKEQATIFANVCNDISLSLDSLKNGSKVLKEKLDSLTRINRELANENRLLKEKLDGLNKGNKELTDENLILLEKNKTQNDEIKKLENKIKELEGTIKSLKPKPKPKETFTSERVSYLNQSFDVFIVDIKDYELALFWKNDKNQLFQSFENVSQYLKKQGKELIFAANAGIFNPEHIPEGLFVQNGIEKIPVNLKSGSGNFYMNFGEEDKSNGIFIIDESNNAKIIKAKEHEKYKTRTQFATQSGPLLLYDEKINPKFTQGSTNVNIRNGVGYISPTKIVFIISNQPVNLYDFAAIFKEKYNCIHALYLDGAISKTYLPSLKRQDAGGDFSGIIGVSRKK
jgi:uncharacterized protein YigE (DUF2233 family)